MRAMTLTKAAALGAACVAAALLVTAVGCAPKATLEPPARTVAAVLEARRALDADVKSYAPYFEDETIADQLAQASADATAVPIPQWEAPYVSAEGTSTASVVVKWRPDKRFPDVPSASVFELKLIEGRWLIVDASDATTDIPKPIQR